VQAFARATQWIYQHPDEWIQGYYVEQQGLTADEGRYLAQSAGAPDVPTDWKAAIERQQATIDLLAQETGKPRLNAADLFDRRYEFVAGQALETP
jgi:sulfonate transport system substrate-binding protein